jgi:TRAP-type C4-dicarboxylate transport system substrate-binding protein
MLPWEAIASIKAQEFTKFESETDPKSRALYTAVLILAMNQAKYDGLPPDLKSVIDANSGAALSKTAGGMWDASALPARKIAADHGNAFYVIPASELDGWQKATASLADDWMKDVAAKGEDGRMLLQAAKDLIRKYDAR